MERRVVFAGWLFPALLLTPQLAVTLVFFFWPAAQAILQLAGKAPTENSRGLRLGNLVQIRDVIAEDLEGVFAGKSEPKAALDDAVARGNAILRQFQKNVQ